MKIMRRHLPLASLPACFIFLVSCNAIETISSIGASVGVATGRMSEKQADALRTTGKAAGKAAERITPEQEHYIGRTVSANILARYNPLDNQRAITYLNLMGQTLAAASDRPQTFGGYHFLVLDSDEINAFAAPGGFIFVSRGLIRCCGTEDQLAAVLAHEIAHVQLRHGLRAIKASRITVAVKIGLSETARTYGDRQVERLTEVFEDTIGDIASTLIDGRYSRKLELRADSDALVILARVGYDPSALIDMLTAMKERLEPGGRGFAGSHPLPEVRIKAAAGSPGKPFVRRPAEAARQTRFAKALAGI